MTTNSSSSLSSTSRVRFGQLPDINKLKRDRDELSNRFSYLTYLSTVYPPEIPNAVPYINHDAIKSSSTYRTISQIQSLSKLLEIATNAKTKLSFWGTRYLSIKGMDESVPVDTLARRLMQLLMEKPELHHLERTFGVALAVEIDRLYVEEDSLVKSCHWITRLFLTLCLSCYRRCGGSRFTPSGLQSSRTRWYWSGRGCNNDGTINTIFKFNSIKLTSTSDDSPFKYLKIERFSGWDHATLLATNAHTYRVK